MGSNEKGPIDSDLQREGKGPPKLRFGNMHEKGHRSSDYGTCCEESKSFSEKFGIGPPHVGDSVMGGPEGFRPPRRAPGGFAPRGRQTAAAQTLPWGKTISPGVPEGRGVPEGPGGSQEGRQAVPVGPGPPPRSVALGTTGMPQCTHAATGVGQDRGLGAEGRGGNEEIKREHPDQTRRTHAHIRHTHDPQKNCHDVGPYNSALT